MLKLSWMTLEKKVRKFGMQETFLVMLSGLKFFSWFMLIQTGEHQQKRKRWCSFSFHHSSSWWSLGTAVLTCGSWPLQGWISDICITIPNSCKITAIKEQWNNFGVGCHYSMRNCKKVMVLGRLSTTVLHIIHNLLGTSTTLLELGGLLLWEGGNELTMMTNLLSLGLTVNEHGHSHG